MIIATPDMDRVGDYVVHIPKETITIGKANFVYPIRNMEEMRSETITITMLETVMVVFTKENVEKVREQLLKVCAEQSDNFSQIIELSFICRYLERSADHATNIAEHLFYLVNGRHSDLNN